MIRWSVLVQYETKRRWISENETGRENKILMKKECSAVIMTSLLFQLAAQDKHESGISDDEK